MIAILESEGPPCFRIGELIAFSMKKEKNDSIGADSGANIFKTD